MSIHGIYNHKLVELISKSIYELSNFENLYISGNKLLELPQAIIKLKTFQWLCLCENIDLHLNKPQQKWLQELAENGCKIFCNK